MATYIDRKSTPPLLLKVSYRKDGSFNKAITFESNSVQPENLVKLYTWKDATLKEILRDTIEISKDYELALEGTDYMFGAVYPHMKDGRYDLRKIGRMKRGADMSDDRVQPMLDSRFVIGDRIDIGFGCRFLWGFSFSREMKCCQISST